MISPLKNKKIIYSLFVFLFSSLTNVVGSEGADVVISTTKGKNYYHLKYSLTKDNISHIDLFTKKEIERNGGQFQLLIKKEAFPISAPKCKSDLILRMPWTDSYLTNGQKFINEKNHVYSAIRDVFNSAQNDSLDVYIELNPYVKRKNGEYELTQCNIFFRQSKGQYIMNVGKH